MKTYTGGCHCGKVRYEVTTDIDKVMQCNCSICSKRAHLLSFVGADQFKLLTGEDALSEYKFGKMIIHHVFCSTCGIATFARGRTQDGKAMVGVNARCIDDLDVSSLPVQHVDGKSF